ncbi:FAD dependent oxidoreductase [Lasiosphaeria miniovina]|uniref:FAD dependent oxidoreductase n=1 Tax=Lasiosphaeria miniovina TaxID=1954250 RepID=A0AA39ZYN0_9PEZI|nr:FAD dependent oxidoreductase [Lasiosphaeria miniovina]KAK0706082.1 FAD dependent oxidoreductase [Lasiosphaeria miniovina]
MDPAASSYLIVGSGVFGASTALHLARRFPGARITLVDRDHYDAPRRVAASWDWNKVVRADYSDITYARLALEAQGLWRADPLWQRFYHESGVVWISPGAFAQTVRDNFAALGATPDASACSVDEARGIYGGLFAGADYTAVREVHVNRSSGWAEAKEALQSTVAAAVALGVEYRVAQVAAVAFDMNEGARGRCCGVTTADGALLAADRVVLCSGAYTPKLLIDSDPTWGELHAGGRILAAGVTEATAPLDEDERAVLEAMPIGINENPVQRGCDVGCMPLPSLGAFKCWGQVFVRNTVTHPVTNEQLSAPPLQPDYKQWDVPAALQEDVSWALKSLFGDKFQGKKMENFRVCWEAVTPSDDFIVSPHPACDGLFIATCGSFHGFKFLPVLGKYVVQMLCDELAPDLQKQWAWDRELSSTEGNKKWPCKELGDFIAEDSRE